MKTTKHNITNTAEPIKPGYKKTKVGVIPEDWEVKRFESITQDKGLIRGPFGGTLKKEIFVESGYKVYEQQNAIYKSSELGEYYITEEKFKELERFSVQIDNFIVSCSGTIGRIYRIPENFQKGIINQALLLIKINPKVIKYDFFNYIFESEVIQRKILEVQGGAMKNLVGMSEIRKVKFPIPPLPEQNAIADCLSTWDKGIEKLSALIAAKKEQKKGLMQGLFSGELKVENGELVKVEDKENWLKGWKEVRLGEVLKESKIISKENDKFKRISVRLHLEGVDQRPVRGTEADSTTFYKRKAGQFIYGKQNFHNGALGIIPEEFDGFETTSDIPSFDINDKINHKWFFYYVSRYDFYRKMESRTMGTGSKRLHPNELFSTKIPYPSLEEQTAIAEFLQTADKEIELLEKQLTQLELQKKGLMQVLLTGTKRLVDNEQ